jgi:bacteriorhodopsin
MTPQFWLWLGCVGMAAGAVVILFMAKRRTPTEEADGIIHGIVPIIAACSYFAMATGQGSLVLPAGPDAAEAARQFYFARYIDWTFTTPLLLVGLSLTAMHSGLRRPAIVWGLIGSDLLMVVTALAFGLSDSPAVKWTWFAISCGAFLAVFYGIFVQLRQENAGERGDVRKAFLRNAVFLTGVWSAYPIVLLVGQDGLGLLSPTLALAAIAILDLTAKVVYGIMATLETTRAVDRDLKEGRAPTTPLRQAA